MVVWVPPARYANVTSEEAETIVSMLKVLSMIYDRILDKNLGVCVSAFVEWMEENNSTANVNPMTILRKVLTHSLTYSLTHLLTHSLTHSPTHSLTRSQG